MELTMNKVTRRIRKRLYSDMEKQEIVDKFLSSGLSRSDFCEQENISGSSLYRWRKELPQCNGSNASFIPITTNSPIFSEVALMKIKLSHGIEFLIPEGFSPSYVATLIKELN